MMRDGKPPGKRKFKLGPEIAQCRTPDKYTRRAHEQLDKDLITGAPRLALQYECFLVSLMRTIVEEEGSYCF